MAWCEFGFTNSFIFHTKFSTCFDEVDKTNNGIRITDDSPRAFPWTHSWGYPSRLAPIWEHRAVGMRNGIEFKFMLAKFIESVLECVWGMFVQPKARAKHFWYPRMSSLYLRLNFLFFLFFVSSQFLNSICGSRWTFVYLIWFSFFSALFWRHLYSRWISLRSWSCKYFCLSESHKSMGGWGHGESHRVTIFMPDI